jgi:diguanylate cyclase (GGDEF)-like protein
MVPVSSPHRTRPGDLGSGGPSQTTAHSTARPTLFQRWFGQGTPELGPVPAPAPRQPSSFALNSSSWTDAETPSDPGLQSQPPAEAAVELPTHLESLLGIAERLASTHDRAELMHRIVEETKVALRADYVTIRILDGDLLPVTAYAGMDDGVAARLPVFRREEGWFGEVLRTGRPVALRDAHEARLGGVDPRYSGVIDFAGDLIAPLIRADRVIGTLAAVTFEPRDWTQQDVTFITTVATHASIALVNAELFEQTEARAAQLAVLQAASARMNRENTVEQVGRAIVEETRRIIDYHNARVYVMEPPDAICPIAFEGSVGEYDKVDLELLRCRLGEGFSGWVALHGEPLVIDDANADPRGATIAGTDDIDESMLVVPMRYDRTIVGVITLSKLGLGQFGAEDLRLLSILADQAATALESARLLAQSQDLAGELRRLLDMSSQLSGSLDPRQVANLIASHLADALGVEEAAISYWDRGRERVVSLGYHPETKIDELEPYFEVSGYPETLRVLQRQEVAIIDAEDPNADPNEVRLLLNAGNRGLVMLPLVAKDQSIGLVELFSKSALHWSDQRLQLARTMANEAAMALENARLYEDARNLADRDPLTGFYNHRFLHERLGEEVVRAQRARRPLSLLMLDLDDFKLVNDTFGHLFGDRVLTWTAELIRSTLRASDVPARYGGDEFAIILPETDHEEARRAAERILEAFRSRAFVGEQRGPVPISASIGVATYPQHGRTPTELIAASDGALYTVKRDGGHDAAVAADFAA